MILLPLVDDFNAMSAAWHYLGSINDLMHVLDEMLEKYNAHIPFYLNSSFLTENTI